MWVIENVIILIAFFWRVTRGFSSKVLYVLPRLLSYKLKKERLEYSITEQVPANLQNTLF